MMISALQTPDYRITLDGEDITVNFNPRLIQLTLTENRSEEADQLDIVLDDSKNDLAIPRKGVLLTLALGFKGETLTDKGSFIVDEVSHSGPPDVLTIRARSAELTSNLRRRRDQSWHRQTLDAIIKTIAARNELQSRIDPSLANQVIEHMDQSSESDIAFVTRLARHFDAVSTVKKGKLLFLTINNTKTSKGESLPTLTIDRTQTQSHSYTSADRDSYTGVQASYEDTKTARRGTVQAGTDENLKVLSQIYANKEEAQKEADAEWQRIERGVATLSLQLATGMPDFMPQSVVKVTGFKSQLNETTWLAVSVSHSLTAGGGMLTSVELEVSSQKMDVDS